MRRSSLNYFFDDQYFGYSGRVFDINTRIMKKYFIFLKNYNKVSIQTRKNKWHILCSFLSFTAEDYDEFNITIPRKTVSWKGAVLKSGAVKTNADVIASKEEIQSILSWLKSRNFKYYVMYRTLIETGMRVGELINLKIDNINFIYRHFNVKIGKTGEKIYNFTQEFSEILELWVESRKKINSDNNFLFITKYRERYSRRTINLALKRILKKLGIETYITTKTFRKTLNTLRKKKLNCPNEKAKTLIGHASRDVNIKNYTIYDYEDLRDLYDQYNPYLDCKF